MSVQFRDVADDEIPELAAVAKRIWDDYFPPLIGQAQVDYMVERFQSAGAIADQRAEGVRYVWIDALYEVGSAPMGYLAYRHEPAAGALFVSKFYLEPRARRKGVGWGAQRRLEEEAARLGARSLRLTVNRENQGAVAAYKNWGYVIVKEQVVDIGGGFVMDDYVMEKKLADPDDRGGE
ncbi:MAG: GNAT family N-acetyltransferase [Nitrospinae bacterium]|nr:GNAT family N-acetyltransferase [Nitrospinota bacterium]